MLQAKYDRLGYTAITLQVCGVRAKKFRRRPANGGLSKVLNTMKGCKVLAGAFAVGAVLMLAGCGNSAASHMAKAQKYLNQDQYRSAMIEYKNVLQKKPNDPAARLGLGRAYLALGDMADAQEQLERAQKLGATPSKVTLPLVNALIQQDKFDKALSLLASNKDALKDDAAEVSVLRGDALLGQRKLSDAENAYTHALSLKPNLALAEVGRARIAAMQQDWAAAQKALDKAITADSKSAQAWMLRGQVNLQQRALGKARTAFERITSGKASHGNTPQVRFKARLHLAGIQIEQDRLTTAQHTVTELLKAAPKHPVANYLQALIDVRQNKLTDAGDHLQTALNTAPKYVPALTLLGEVKLAQGDTAQAQMYLSSAVSLDPNNPRTRQMLADAQMNNSGSQKGAASSLLADNNSAKDYKVKLTNQQGNGLEQLQQKASQAPNNPGLRFTLAQALLEHGENEQALSVLNRIPESGSQTGLTRDRLRIAAYLRTKNLPAALDAVKKMLKAHPKEAQAYVLASNVYMIANRNDDAKAALDKARSLAPHSPDVLLNAAVLALRTGHKEQAQSDFHAILKESPKNVQALMGLARIAAMSGDVGEATKWMEEARTAAPKALAPRIVLVRLYILQKQPQKALSIAREAIKLQPNNAVALNLLGAAQWSVGNRSGAVDSFQKAIKAAPGNMAFRLHLAHAQITLKHDAEAVKTLQAIIDRQPSLVEASRLLALVQMRQGNDKAALATVKHLGEEPGAGPAAAELEGDLYMAQKAYAKADKAYQKSLSDKASSVVLMKDFAARVRADVGQPEQPLLHWLGAHPKDVAVRNVLAQWYLRKHDLQAAAQQYEKVVAANPNDMTALNNLAWIYGEQNNPKALDLARKAHQAAPDNASIADTLGWLELKAGHADEALKLLTKAAGKASDNPEIQYHLAVAQAKAGYKEDAKATLKQLIAAKAKFPQRDAAKQLLDQLTTE